MNSFYQDIIVEKSWQILKDLRKKIDFVLIGGWAVYLYTKSLKSKDIDIIVNFEQLGKLKKEFELYKNERLKKYEIKKEGIDLDIYLPYFSNLGLPVAEIIKHQEKIEGFSLLKKEILLITKQKAYSERKMSIKGQKDKIDILALIILDDFDFSFYKTILANYQVVDYEKQLKTLIEEVKELPELSLNKHFFSKKKKEILKSLSKKR